MKKVLVLLNVEKNSEAVNSFYICDIITEDGKNGHVFPGDVGFTGEWYNMNIETTMDPETLWDTLGEGKLYTVGFSKSSIDANLINSMLNFMGYDHELCDIQYQYYTTNYDNVPKILIDFVKEQTKTFVFTSTMQIEAKTLAQAKAIFEKKRSQFASNSVVFPK